jgi:nitrogen-specific signal transduction histidine kinase/CHASE3 domain sensor protein
MASFRLQSLSFQLVLASLVSVVALGVVCGVGIVSMRRLSAMSSTALRGQMDLFENASGLQELLYQKGFVASYMLTGERDWLEQLDRSRQLFAGWLERAQAQSGPLEGSQHLVRIAGEYGAHDEARRQVIAAFDAGRRDEALTLLKRSSANNQKLLALCHEYSQIGRGHAQRELGLAQRSLQTRTEVLLAFSVAGLLASLAVGFLLARRIGRPIYELQLQVASAVQKTRLSVAPGRAGLEALGDHMAALLQKLAETDAAILEHRRRLIQSEKMSAIGDVAAKLAHEILNPLAGMKAATQLLRRSTQGGGVSTGEVNETTDAIDQQIERVDQLVRRLIQFAKPLAPRRETCRIHTLFDAVNEAAKTELEQAGVRLRRDEDLRLPKLEIDPLLMTQALVNLVINGIQVTPRDGCVTLRAQRVSHHGQELLTIQVLDEGEGLDRDFRSKLFQPFCTTKPSGHGLGLAITQNIITEHGGQVSARDREDRRGALFEVLLPLER